jgi:hypothetical protein
MDKIMKLMHQINKVWLFTSAILCCLCCSRAYSYTTDSVPVGYYDLIIWPFQANDLNNIFDPTDQTILIEVLVSGTWESSYSLGSGFSPDFTLEPGEAFFIYNWGTSDRSYTISGMANSSSSTILSLTGGQWNGVGAAYYSSANGFLTCVYEGDGYDGYPDTHHSYNYSASTGDLVEQWSLNSQAYVEYAVTTDTIYSPHWTNCLSGLSPTVCTGKGMLIKPVSNNTWTQYPTNPQCGSSTGSDSGFTCPP